MRFLHLTVLFAALGCDLIASRPFAAAQSLPLTPMGDSGALLLASFVDALTGTVALAGQLQYNKAKNFTAASGQPFNYKTPLMVVFCTSEEDVALAIAYARSAKLPLCVRAGGTD